MLPRQVDRISVAPSEIRTPPYLPPPPDMNAPLQCLHLSSTTRDSPRQHLMDAFLLILVTSARQHHLDVSPHSPTP